METQQPSKPSQPTSTVTGSGIQAGMVQQSPKPAASQMISVQSQSTTPMGFGQSQYTTPMGFCQSQYTRPMGFDQPQHTTQMGLGQGISLMNYDQSYSTLCQPVQQYPFRKYPLMQQNSVMYKSNLYSQVPSGSLYSCLSSGRRTPPQVGSRPVGLPPQPSLNNANRKRSIAIKIIDPDTYEEVVVEDSSSDTSPTCSYNKSIRKTPNSEVLEDKGDKVSGKTDENAKVKDSIRPELEPSPVVKEKHPSQYSYPKGQWSPNNPDGSKKYDRQFLISLRDHPLSNKKPENFPAAAQVIVRGFSSNVRKKERNDNFGKKLKKQGEESLAILVEKPDQPKFEERKNASSETKTNKEKDENSSKEQFESVQVVETLQKKIKELQADNENLEKNNKTLQSKLELFMAYNKEHISNLREFQRRLEELQAAYEKLENVKENLQTELDKSTVELKSQSAKMLLLEQQNINNANCEESTGNDLMDKFMKLVEVATCAVCLDVLRSDVVQCVNGHVMCKGCKGNIKICPSCRYGFADKICVFVSQMLEILPSRCKYTDCPVLLDGKEDEEHEKYCGFRPTNCKWCEWKGHGRDMCDHMEQDHSKDKSSSMDTHNAFEININECNTTKFLYQRVDDFIIWVKLCNNPEKEFLTFTWIWVPNGKPKYNSLVTYTFTTLNLTIESKLKINFDPGVDIEKENKYTLPHGMLNSSIDDKGKLTFKASLKFKPI